MRIVGLAENKWERVKKANRNRLTSDAKKIRRRRGILEVWCSALEKTTRTLAETTGDKFQILG